MFTKRTEQAYGMAPDRARAHRRLRVKPLIVACLGAALFGLSVTLVVKNFWALGVEAGGSCGSDDGVSLGPCPQGLGWMLPLGIIGTIAALPITGSALVMAKAGRWGPVALVPMILVGALGAFQVFAWLHGPTLKTVWEASTERPTGVEGLGSWQYGSSVLRARFDGVVSYDVATGRRGWAYDLPSPQVVCAMSRSTEHGIGLVGHADESQPCTRLSAIDLQNGRELWNKTITASTAAPTVQADVVAMAGDTAATVGEREIKGFTAREGGERWTATAGGDQCRFHNVAGGGDQFLTEVDCLQTQPKIRAIDAATGRTRWETAVPIRSTYANITLLSAAPVLVHIVESGQRGTNVLAGLDQTGRITAQIQADDGERRLDLNDTGFDAAPARRLLLQDGTVVVGARSAEGDDLLTAYTLSDGRERWSTELPEAVAALRPAGGDRIVYIEGNMLNPRLGAVSLRTGHRSDLGVVVGTPTSSAHDLYLSGAYYAVVNESATAPKTHPVTVLKAG